MVRGLLFDLDGTLVNSLPGIAEALNLALAEHSLPQYTEKEVTAFIGAGAQALADRALGEKKAALGPQILEGFQRHYARTWKRGTHHFPGILPALEKYHQKGLRLGVLSNKPHHYTTEIVAELFPEHLFDPVYGAREGIPAKPDPASALEIARQWQLSPSEISYVGDSTVDYATAQNSGMIPAILSWGYGAPEKVPLCDTMQELDSFLQLP